MGAGASATERTDKLTFRQASRPELNPQDRDTINMIASNCSALFHNASNHESPSPSLRVRAQSVIRGSYADAENNPWELVFYARDLFFEAAGESSSIDMHVFAILLEEVLCHLSIHKKTLISSVKSEIRDAVLNHLSLHLGMSALKWDETEKVIDSLAESTVRYSQFFKWSDFSVSNAQMKSNADFFVEANSSSSHC